MLRTIIIDDEEMPRNALKSIIAGRLPNIEVVAEAESVESGTEAIIQKKPDLVFLDIDLKDGTGFELLEKLHPVQFKVIFITGFRDFAIKAFKFSALDYILKPINSEELVNAVIKAENEIKLSVQSMKLDVLLSNIKTSSNGSKKIVLKTQEFIHLVDIQSIIHCQSDNSYITFYLNTCKKIVITGKLKDYEEILEPHGFFRVHQSHLVNLHSISRFDKREGGFIIMNNEETVPVAQRKRQELIKIFENML